MTDGVLLQEVVAEVGSPGRTLTLLDRMGAKLAQDPFGRLIVPVAEASKVRDLVRQEAADYSVDVSRYAAWQAGELLSVIASGSC